MGQDAFYYLKEPIQIVAGEDSPVPFSKILEQEGYLRCSSISTIDVIVMPESSKVPLAPGTNIGLVGPFYNVGKERFNSYL